MNAEQKMAYVARAGTEISRAISGATYLFNHFHDTSPQQHGLIQLIRDIRAEKINPDIADRILTSAALLAEASVQLYSGNIPLSKEVREGAVRENIFRGTFTSLSDIDAGIFRLSVNQRYPMHAGIPRLRLSLAIDQEEDSIEHSMLVTGGDYPTYYELVAVSSNSFLGGPPQPIFPAYEYKYEFKGPTLTRLPARFGPFNNWIYLHLSEIARNSQPAE